MKKFTTLAAMGMLLVAAATYMPTVSAHNCTAETGTAAEEDCMKVCREGEDHHHKVTHHHENGLAEDENHVHYECETRSGGGGGGGDNGCSTPKVVGICIIDTDSAPSPGGGAPTPPTAPAVPECPLGGPVASADIIPPFAPRPDLAPIAFANTAIDRDCGE